MNGREDQKGTKEDDVYDQKAMIYMNENVKTSLLCVQTKKY